MQPKILSSLFLFIFFGFIITSCLSITQRNPSSDINLGSIDDLLKDTFTKEGYLQAQKRDFGASRISNEQVVKELAGRSIWFRSAPNSRHHTFVFPQKIGVSIDWMQAFAANLHDMRFQTWGIVNDPDCCTPGVSCEQKNMKYNGRSVTLADTFGWDFCKNDEEL